MAAKMVNNIRRSISSPSPQRQGLHVRSTSLPCRSHPIVSQLRDRVSDLRSWESGPRSSAWLCDGLRRLKAVHEALDDVLHLPLTRDSLRGGACSCLVDNLLEDFLRLVDVFGNFQTLFLNLKEEHSASQIAVRRRDDSKIAAHRKSLSKIAKEIGRLESNFSSIAKSPGTSGRVAAENDAVELIETMNDVIRVTASTSSVVFGGVAKSSAFRRQTSVGLRLGKKTKEGIVEFHEVDLENLKKKTEEEIKTTSKRMQEMEDCMGEIERSGERTFRSLINTRVSFLNLLTR